MNTDNFIEKLNEAPSLRGFLLLTVNQFTQEVDKLVYRVFHKTDFALKSVVNSLFEHQGPLADLSVRLKLLLGLGIISPQTFEDISAFIELKQHLNNEIEELPFSHTRIIHFIQNLKHIDLMPIAELLKFQTTEKSDSMLIQIQQARLERVIKSSLILAITNICEELNVESPL